MTTSAPATAKKNVDTEVQYAESVIAWNVKMLLTAQNKSQSALAAFWVLRYNDALIICLNFLAVFLYNFQLGAFN